VQFLHTRRQVTERNEGKWEIRWKPIFETSINKIHILMTERRRNPCDGTVSQHQVFKATGGLKTDNELVTRATLLIPRRLHRNQFAFSSSQSGVAESSGTSATVYRLYHSSMMHIDDWTGKGNRNIRTQYAKVPLGPPQIPRDLLWRSSRAAVVESRRLIA
jgi:hypothetical protein